MSDCGLMQQPSKLGYRMGPQRNDQHLTISKLLVTRHSKVGEEKPKCAIRLNKTGSWARLNYVIDVPVWPPGASVTHRWQLSASQCIV